jgi:hypothetical protein
MLVAARLRFLELAGCVATGKSAAADSREITLVPSEKVPKALF